MNTHAHILVLGGTGKTGRRVAQRLEARGVPTRVGSRSGDPAFSWEDRATWAPALAGASAVYVSFFPDLAVPGACDSISELSSLAVDRGVRRLVLLSGRGEEEAQRAEQIVMASGLEWTIVRCAWFNQNFSESFLLDPILAGEVALPVTDIAEPFVDADDIADVAVTALTEDGHAGQVYELTGPRLLRFDEAVAQIARASGREIRFVPITLDQFAEGMQRDGLPEDVVWLVSYLFAEVLDGRNAHLADGRAACARTRAAGLCRLRPRDRGDWCLERPMSDSWVRWLTIVSAIGAGISGGVFFAFSTFVMKGLHDLPPGQGIAAMNSINKAAPADPWFMTVLFGAALTSVALIVHATMNLDDPGARYRIIAGALCLVAPLLTIAYHVPRNDALAGLNPTSAEAARYWAGYVTHWTAWNHLRTIAPLASAAVFIISQRRS